MGARPLPRAVPPRLAARRRRARRDAGDRDVLVAPPAAVRRGEGRARVGSLGEGALVLCHVSHVYETGCSLYFTVAARQGDDPLAQWAAAKAAASDAMIAAGATITHHHAVGTDHKPWFAREIGPVGVQIAARGQGLARPGRRAQPGGADPVTPRRPPSLPGQPRLRRRRRAGRGRPGRPPAARRRGDGRGDLLARPAGHPRRWWPTRSPAATSVVSVGGDGMLSLARRRGGAPRRHARHRARRDGATTSPGCSACPTTRWRRPTCCSPARPAGSTSSRGRRRRLARGRRLGLRRRRRPGRRDRRPGPLAARPGAVPATPRVRVAGDVPPARYRVVVDGVVARVRRRDRRRRQLAATTARAWRSRPPPASTTGCSTWS